MDHGNVVDPHYGLEPGRPSPIVTRQRQRPHWHSLSFQVTLAVIAVGLLGILLLAGFVSWAMLRVDSNAAAREKTLISRAVDEQVAAVRREQQKITLGDEAFELVRAGDQLWMAENVGEWMNSSYGHEMGFVLDEADRPVYAMADGASIPATDFKIYSGRILPLVAELRQLMKQDAALGEAGLGGVMMIKGRPSIVTVKPIVRSSKRLNSASGDEHLHIAVKHVDSDFFASLGERYLVANVRFRHTETALRNQNAVPIAGGEEGLLGYLVWDRERPGLQLIKEAAPGLTAAGFLVSSLVISLLVRLRRAAVQIHKSETRAQHLAFHDTLTGMPNRALLNHSLDRALAAATESGAGFALHYVDLDRFKNVNDTLGHPAGDELIRQVAARLAQVVRGSDMVARLGGDEFAIIQADLRGQREAEQFAARVIQAMKPPFEIFGNQVFMDASVGIALAPDFAVSRQELLRKADIALYEAKGAGKGCYCVFEVALDDAVREKQIIERDLRDALEHETGLRVAYQPLYAIDGKTMIGAEALIRWDHAVRGAVSPAIFVPVAEERGLVQRLGAWVLREACRTARELNLPWVAVNVSAIQFRDPAFVDSVLDLLDGLSLSPERLQLEITEGLLLDSGADVGAALSKLRSAGVRIALDDFGTGYSSLQYLHRYEVDKIKIDRTFVQMLDSPGSSGAIVRAMLDLARGFNLSATAEGVETPDQWRALADFGCSELQGFLFSKPVGPEMLRVLHARSLNGDLESQRRSA